MLPTGIAILSRLFPLTSQKIYLVGGSVRDLLIGVREISDLDILIPSGSEAVSRAFADRIGGSFFFLDEERRITRVVRQENGTRLQFDFTNFEGPDLQADLFRRDFTVNAMALDLRQMLEAGGTDGLIDLFSGRSDLGNRIIRMTNPGVFDADPLRMLRAVRFAAALNFTIDPATREQIRSRADRAAEPAPERIRDEFFQVLGIPGSGAQLLLMDELGLLPRLVPELDTLTGFSPGRYHVYDVRTHSLKAADYIDAVLDDLAARVPEHGRRVIDHLDRQLEHGVSRKAALRFACLLHDIAKPDTLSRDEEGHIHFYGHDNLGAVKAQAVCGRFRLSRDTTTAVTAMIKQHMRLFNLSAPGGPSKNAMFRYCRDLGEALPESLMLAQADARATFDIMPREKFLDTEKPMLTVLEYYYEKFLKTGERPLVTGQDLIDRGLPPGPRFRQILDEIRERQSAGTIRDRNEALAFLDTLK